MRGLKSNDLVAIVDFPYGGEANVFQEDLDSFLAIAEELQLKPEPEQENPAKNQKNQKLRITLSLKRK